jgi:16S rRNA (guanine966-N2)-methyltransferase
MTTGARPHRAPPREVRIIGGQWKRSKLPVADAPGLRPTPDRVRETLFNWLGQDLAGWRCLDAFAGSGALGFEAASRGAARVVMVEKDRTAIAELERSRAALGADQVAIVGSEATVFLAKARERFDVVFLDPPFRQNALPAILGSLPPHLEPGARVYVESDAPMEPSSPWTELKRGNAGQVSYQLLQLLQWNANEGQP